MIQREPEELENLVRFQDPAPSFNNVRNDIMPDCEVVRSTKVVLDTRMKWNLKLDFNGQSAFDPIDLEEMIIAGADISRCKNYGEYEDAIVVVFELKRKN